MISRILASLPELILAALALYMLSHVPQGYQYPTSSGRVDTIQIHQK